MGMKPKKTNPNRRELIENGFPLLVYPSLAKEIGLNEAIIISQVHYWLQKSTNFRDGHWWIYHKYREWESEFPFWSKNTIIRAITSLRDDGYLITDKFNKAGYDKTLWYRIDYSKLNALQLNDEQNNLRPSKQKNEVGSYPEWVGKVPKMGKPIPETLQRLKNNSGAGISSPIEDETFKVIINYLNEQSGNEYDVTNETKELIEVRFSEGFTEQDFMDVIKDKAFEWGNSDEMKPFLRPNTLFGNKMPKYLKRAKAHLSSE